MSNHVRSWLFVDRLSRPIMVLDRLPGLYGLKYDSATAGVLLLYLCSYKLVGSATYTGKHGLIMTNSWFNIECVSGSDKT